MERNCACERLSRVRLITKNGGQAIDLVASTAVDVGDKTMQLDDLFQPDWLPPSDNTSATASETTPSARNACRTKIDSALAANITADVRAKVCVGADRPSDCHVHKRCSAVRCRVRRVGFGGRILLVA